MKKKILFLVLGGLLILFITLIVYSYNFFPKNKTSESSTPTINITYDNLAKELSKNPIIESIPNDAEILIRFYNFSSGEKVFEKNYLIKENKIQETTQESAEVILFLNSKYLSQLTNKNLCAIIKKANNGGDLQIETKLSGTKMAWKFKSLLKYKDCF